jgi:hypothetical protein
VIEGDPKRPDDGRGSGGLHADPTALLPLFSSILWLAIAAGAVIAVAATGH